MIKNYFALVFALFLLNNIYSQTTAIPDANFEQILIDLGVDSDGTINQSVLTSDISGITHLSIPDQYISDLTGIEGFTDLIFLNLRVSNLTSLDLSANTKLIELDCFLNQLTSVNLGANTSLISLNFFLNNLTSLDVSQNTSLQYLHLGGNQLTNLDVSTNTDLRSLTCEYNQLESLDLKNGTNSKITQFNAENNPSLTCIQIDNEATAGVYSSWQKDDTATYSEDCGYSLSIDDDLLAKGLNLYPNPVTNILTIDSEIPLTRVEIYSMLGKKVKEINSDFNSIRTNSLSNGVYIFKIYSENGIATKKLIKK